MAMFNSSMNNAGNQLNTGSSSSMSSGGLPSQSPFSRLVDAVGANNIPGLPGSSSSSGSSPFSGNSSIEGSGGAFFSGGAGGAAGNESPFDGIRTKLDTFFSNQTYSSSTTSSTGGSPLGGSTTSSTGGSPLGGSTTSSTGGSPLGGSTTSSTGGGDNPIGGVSGGSTATSFQVRVAIDQMVNSSISNGSSDSNTSSDLSDYITKLIQNPASTTAS